MTEIVYGGYLQLSPDEIDAAVLDAVISELAAEYSGG